MRIFSFFDQNHDFYSLQAELKVLVEKFLKTSSLDEINEILDPEKNSKNLATIKCESDTGQLGGFPDRCLILIGSNKNHPFVSP